MPLFKSPLSRESSICEGRFSFWTRIHCCPLEFFRTHGDPGPPFSPHSMAAKLASLPSTAHPSSTMACGRPSVPSGGGWCLFFVSGGQLAMLTRCPSLPPDISRNSKTGHDAASRNSQRSSLKHVHWPTLNKSSRVLFGAKFSSLAHSGLLADPEEEICNE